MAGPSEPREDIDALLSVLEAPSAGAPAVPGASTRGTPSDPAADVAAPADGRTDFSDLFAVEKAAPPRGDLDEKLEWFRERLRQAETQLGRVREAWATREAELAAAESALARERTASAEARAQVATMQRFLESKKAELVAYAAKVKQALIDKDIRIEVLEQELAEQKAAAPEVTQALADSEGRIAALEQELARHQATLAAERRDARKQRDWSDAAAVQAATTVAKLSEGLRAAVARWQALAAELDEIDRALPPLRPSARHRGR